MKRLLVAILSATALALTGFSASSAAQTPQPKAAATKAAATAKSTAAPDTLAKLKASKQINVAVSADSFPMSFIKDKNDPVGYSIDLCKRVIAQLGRAAGVPDLKTNWIVGTVSERIAMVASGKADIDCANTTATLGADEGRRFLVADLPRVGRSARQGRRTVQKFADLGGTQHRGHRRARRPKRASTPCSRSGSSTPR